jgi:hypothetical protein
LPTRLRLRSQRAPLCPSSLKSEACSNFD